MEVIDTQYIAEELKRRKIFPVYEWIFLETVGSTNDVARERLRAESGSKVIIVAARRQTNGRGCGKHRWISEHPNNIYLSFGFPEKFCRNLFLHFSLILAERIARHFHETFAVTLGVKHPNDLLLAGKKVGGILLEVPAEISGWVLGIGINLFSDVNLQSQCAQPVGAIDDVRLLSPNAVILDLCAIAANLCDEMNKKSSLNTKK
jgi:BirA family biotin operon repressor/biotin-[acetyl-CoA-carboxylase] ligase